MTTYNDILILRGGAVKAAITDGVLHLTGYLVRFGDPDTTDLVGDYFARDAYLGIADETPVYYDHGLGALGRKRLGIGRLERVSDGVLIHADVTLDMTNQAEREIADAALAGKLGWSSGTAAHLVVREPVGDGVHVIREWPLGVDASLTPTPAEPRNVVIPLKSLLPEAGDGGAQDEHTQPDPHEERETMTDQLTIDQIKAAMQEQLQAALDEMAAKMAPKTPPAPPPDDEMTAVKAFAAYLRRGEIRAPLKAVTESGSGTALVPVEYGDEFVRALSEGDLFVRAGARVVPQSVLTAKWPKLAAPSAGALVAEEGTYNTTDPSTSEVTATLYKYGNIVKITEEIASDSRFELWGEFLAPWFRDYFAATRNATFTTGTGSGQPEGITSLAATVTAASGTAIDADELIDLVHSVSSQYRTPGCVWMMSDGTFAAIRKLQDANGQYLLAGLADNAPRLLGYPVLINSNMPDIALSAKTIVFGNFGYYWIFQHPDLLMARLSERYADTGHIGYKMAMRWDGHVMQSAAFGVLQMAAV